MKILLAKDAGYCFGVRDAVNLAKKSGDDFQEVYMLYFTKKSLEKVFEPSN